MTTQPTSQRDQDVGQTKDSSTFPISRWETLKKKKMGTHNLIMWDVPTRLCRFNYQGAVFSHVQLCESMDYSPPGSSAHGIFQARILEWVAISYSRGSSQPRDHTRVSCVGRRILYHWTTWEATQLVALHNYTINLNKHARPNSPHAQIW